jgi:hypothetical protein
MSLVAKNMKELEGQVNSLPGFVSAAWWECAGLGQWQKARTLMMKLDSVARENYDRIVSCLAVCMTEDFEAGSNHMKLMAKMKPYMSKVVAESRDVFACCVAIAAEGKMTDAEKTELEEQIKDITDAVSAATKAFHDGKKELGLEGISFDMNDEHAFCLSVCAFGRITVDFANELIDDKTGTKPIPNLVDGTGIMGTFDSGVVFDKKHANLGLRNSCSILIAFAVGFFGYGNVLLSHNAAISSTASILLSSSVGPALAKNLGRLQGVVLGTVVGKLVWAILGWCTWWGYIGLCCALFGWNLLCLYVYYDSPKYGGIACLLAAFGSGNFLVGCTDPLTATFDPAGPFYEIINVVVAIAIIMFVDMTLAPGRASDMALEYLHNTFANIHKSLDDLFDAEQPNVRVKKGTLGGLIGGCAQFGNEAWEEPRFWRTGWKMDLWTKATSTFGELRVTMTAMEYSVTDGGAGGPKTKIFMTLLKKPQFQTIKKVLYDKMDLMAKLCEIFAHETAAPFDELENEAVKVNEFRSEMEAAIKDVMADINKAIKADGLSPRGETNLEDDQAAQVSMCLSSFLMMIDQMDSLQQAIISS